MSERIKKILVIALFLLSVFGIAFALYWAFFRVEPVVEPPTVEPGDIVPTGSLPGSGLGDREEFVDRTGEPTGLVEADEIAQGGTTVTTALSAGPVYNTAISNDGDAINYYSKADSRFYRIDENGEVTSLSDKQFPNVELVTWDRNSEKAILEFPDGSNVVFDFESEIQITLPNHWEDFDFSPVRDEIIAKSIGLDPDNRWLVTINTDGTNAKAFQALGDNEDKVQVNWSPNDQVVAFADTSTSSLSGDIDRKLIFPIGKNKENFKGLVIEGMDFQSKWAPSGKKLLYSTTGSYSNYRPLLWTVDATANTMGENRKSIQLNTWAEKCTWSSATEIYCAVPNSLPANAGLQPGLHENEPDSLFKINIETGVTTLIATPQTETTMADLTVSKDGSVIYYRNTFSDELEMIKLK